MDHNNITCEGSLDDQIVSVSKATIDRILKCDRPCDALALYMFYCYTCKWQKTNVVRATTDYAMEAMGCGEDRVRLAKKELKNLGLVEDVRRVGESNRLEGWFIQVHFLISQKREVHPPEKAEGGNSDHKCFKTGTEKCFKIVKTIPTLSPETNKEPELFPSTTISGVEDPTQAERSTVAAKIQPRSASALVRARYRLCRMFGRKTSSPWSKKEEAGLKVVAEECESDWILLEEYYSHRGEDKIFCRKSIITLLNNWSNDVGWARDWKAGGNQEDMSKHMQGMIG